MPNHFTITYLKKNIKTHKLVVASGTLSMSASTFKNLYNNTQTQQELFLQAQAAGILGAKQIQTIMPIPESSLLDQIKIITKFKKNNFSISVYCFICAQSLSDIDIHALAGVNAALLTIWNLKKTIDPDLSIKDIVLLARLDETKDPWLNPIGVPPWILKIIQSQKTIRLLNKKVVILTMSDRAFKGEYKDDSGALLKKILKQNSANIIDYRILPDEASILNTQLKEIIYTYNPDLILCTGGTGVCPRDITPDTISPLFDRIIPGVGELLRKHGAQYTPFSWSSRALAGIIANTIVISLPGNPAAVEQSMQVLLPDIIPHLINSIRGKK